MKKEWDKRLFLLVLILAFAAFIVADAYLDKEKTDKKNKSEKTEDVLENEALSIRTEKDIIYIDGRGRLDREDLKSLLASEKLSFSDVKNIIIGDGITEIGYDCLIGLDSLETLKIGSGIKKLNNGCIRSCPNLKFIFIPKSVEKIGKDFLVYSSAIAIVSDGDMLDTLIRTEGNYLYEDVVSYEDFKEKIKENPVVYRLDAETELIMDNPELITDVPEKWWKKE